MNAADRELLICLIEECSEVIHAATKMIRHGPDSHNPKQLAGPSNEEQLNREMGHVRCLDIILMDRAILDGAEIADSHRRKLQELPKYLHYNYEDSEGQIVAHRR